MKKQKSIAQKIAEAAEIEPLILDLLRAGPKQCREIAETLGQNHYSIAHRLTFLHKSGMVGRTLPTKNNRAAFWFIPMEVVIKDHPNVNRQTGSWLTPEHIAWQQKYRKQYQDRQSRRLRSQSRV